MGIAKISGDTLLNDTEARALFSRFLNTQNTPATPFVLYPGDTIFLDLQTPLAHCEEIILCHPSKHHPGHWHIRIPIKKLGQGAAGTVYKLEKIKFDGGNFHLDKRKEKREVVKAFRDNQGYNAEYEVLNAINRHPKTPVERTDNLETLV